MNKRNAYLALRAFTIPIWEVLARGVHYTRSQLKTKDYLPRAILTANSMKRLSLLPTLNSTYGDSPRLLSVMSKAIVKPAQRSE